MACSNYCTTEDLDKIIETQDDEILTTQNEEAFEEISEVIEAEEDEDVTTVQSARSTGFFYHYAFRSHFVQPDSPEEGPTTFTVEKAICDNNGKVVYVNGKISKPDFVDYEKNVIVDLKPLHEGEEPEDVYNKYQAQFDRYIKAYEEARHVTPDLQIHFYRIDKDEEFLDE